MESKLIWICMFIGSAAGGYLPLLWDGSVLSLSSVLFSAAGGFLGVWLGYRLGQ